MKKKLLRIPFIVLGVLLVLAIVLVAVFEIQGVIIQQGRYLKTANGNAMLITHNSPTILHNRTNRDLFKGLETGDEILVIRSNVTLESYPGQTGVYAVFKLRDGTIDDIPTKLVEQLIELRWIEA